MTAQLLEGKPIAAKIKESVKKELEALKAASQKTPLLVGVQVGENSASEIYIKSQKKNAELLGIDYRLEKFDPSIKQGELEEAIQKFNRDPAVTGIITQMPLPPHINAGAITRCIDPGKDIEGVHPRNMGEVVSGTARIVPCTPAACMELLNSIQGLELYGKEAVVVGHSDIVGKPVALLLLNKFVTTTVCHIATGERGTLPDFIKKAEILIVACGKACLVKGDWIKPGAIVIDVGINRVGGKIVGDVEFDGASKNASFITPVPGGVGPLTVAMLMKNVLEAFRIQISK